MMFTTSSIASNNDLDDQNLLLATVSQNLPLSKEERIWKRKIGI
jgi:hypothetical protein